MSTIWWKLYWKVADLFKEIFIKTWWSVILIPLPRPAAICQSVTLCSSTMWLLWELKNTGLIFLDTAESYAPWCSERITDFRWWDVHQAHLSYPYDLSGGMWTWGLRVFSNLNSTQLHIPRLYIERIFFSKKNVHGKIWNQTRYLMIRSQELWALGSLSPSELSNVIVHIFMQNGHNNFLRTFSYGLR